MGKTKFLTMFIIVVSFCYSACNDKDGPCDSTWDRRLKLVNSSDSNVYIIHSSMYPDTSFKNTMYNYNESKYRVGYSEKQDYGEVIEYCWNDYINSIESDTLMIFVVLDEGQDRDELKDQHTVLKRYDLTLQDLENMDWTVTYP